MDYILAEHIPIILELTPQQLGFSIKVSICQETQLVRENTHKRRVFLVVEPLRPGYPPPS